METYPPCEYPPHLLKRIAKAREVIKRRKKDPWWQKICVMAKESVRTNETHEFVKYLIRQYLREEITKAKIAERHYEKTR